MQGRAAVGSPPTGGSAGRCLEAAGALLPRRILVTLGVLAGLGKTDEMKVWMRRGLEHGITAEELRGLVVQVTFYAGWPAGLAAGRAALELIENEAPRQQQ
ncbi:MAG: carboxymuconolactone decarboxylase family protein [Variovorax sp.]|nr:MAG: carboxymuconolactone decarboxylase family protein [Variovorax sp.]